MAKEWHIQPPVEPSDALQRAAGHPLVARLLAQRGIQDADVAVGFLDPTQYSPASPWELPGMRAAVALLRQARDDGWPVRVWGDLDADGETATAVLVEALRAAGIDVLYDLPSRREGHGLHLRAFPRLGGGDEVVDAPLVITCDTGVSDVEVAAEARAAGYGLIITDHHDLPDQLPDADALVNPKLLDAAHPLRELSGVGVAYMLARALLEGADQDDALDAMLDLVALGLVADVAVQVRDVRYLIRRGLAVLREGRRPGLAALAGAAGIELAHISARDLAYRLGPRLNAAGRLAHARQGVELLLTEDPAEARELAYALEALNSERQAVTDATQQAVLAALEARPELVRDRPAIVVDGEGWEAGVLGLVAGALTERYNRPAIVIRRGADGVAGGSARSVEGVDIRAAIMSQERLLLGGGGHPMAAGFSIANDDVQEFRHGVWAWLAEHVPERPPAAPLTVDAVVPWRALNLDLARALERLAPHGAGNPEPVLASLGGRMLRVEDVSARRETPHRRLFLADEGAGLHPVIWFQAGELPSPEQRIDVAYQPGVNRYRGQESLQLTLVDWRLASEDDDALLVVTTAVAMAGGREVVDHRSEDMDTAKAIGVLREEHGQALIVWAEATDPPLEYAMGRHDLPMRAQSSLAVAFAPPDAATLRTVVERVEPARVYLLAPQKSHTWEPSELLQQTAGMARWAVAKEDGLLDLERMAARLGLGQGSILAALRVVEAQGVLRLVVGAQGWRVEPGDGTQTPPRRRQIAMRALEGHLCETAAFRAAYRRLALDALFVG